MKKLHKSIISGLTLLSIGVNTTFAGSFPSEPMVIYGNVSGTNIENRLLKIYDSNDVLLKTTHISDGKFGTNKTFDLENKVILGEFLGDLKFQVDDTVLEATSNSCSDNFSFQKAQICEYNFENVNLEIDVIKDLSNIAAEDKTDNFEDIFKGMILETSKQNAVEKLGDNILGNHLVGSELLIANKAVNIDNIVSKDIILVSNAANELIYIPENTNVNQSDLIIEKPLSIADSSNIKTKINRDIYGAIEIPTSKQVHFNSNIRICLDTNLESESGVQIYASHDNSSWFYDRSVKNIKIENGSACFDVNHLTSFALTKNVANSGSRGGGGGGSRARPYCKTEQLECRKVGTKYYMRAIDQFKCRPKNTVETCSISQVDTQPDDSNDGAINESIKLSDIKKQIDNQEIKQDYKLTSKKYITGVRAFMKNSRELKNQYGLQVSYVQGADEYNKIVEGLLLDIHKNMKVHSIKQKMVKHIDAMTTSYAVMNDETLSDDLRNTFRLKFQSDLQRVEKKLKVLKRKDYIVNKVLTQRAIKAKQKQGQQ